MRVVAEVERDELGAEAALRRHLERVAEALSAAR
jgi:hypothetical protein